MTEPTLIAGLPLQHWAAAAQDDAGLRELSFGDMRELIAFAVTESKRADIAADIIAGLQDDVVKLRRAASIARAELLAQARRQQAAISIEAVARHMRAAQAANVAADQCAAAIYSTKRDLPEDGGPEEDEEVQKPEDIVRTVEAAFDSGLLPASMRP